MDSGDDTLRSRLAAVLPKDQHFEIHHLSTPPRKVDALCSAPPNERPDRTYCENHFLTLSINAPSKDSPESSNPVIVLGVEIFIYTTAHSTTLFVSKADSTGYLQLLGLPRGTPSPIREVCTAFISFLVAKRRRKDAQFVVSLFARAQSQYLFPGSAECSSKHVLDDRGLVKWWCRVLNGLLESPPQGSLPSWRSVKGYLVVPGLDTYETRAFIPRSSTSDWCLTHPLERISHYTREFDWVPPRCLIPIFPDDPKSRFRSELDEEAAESHVMQTTGSWKSVKTLETFWELMAFRQECSSGRMTGFIWLVFDNQGEEENLPTPEASFREAVPSTAPETPKKQTRISAVTPTTTPRKLFPSKTDTAEPASSQAKLMKKKKATKKTKLKGIIIPRRPRVKTAQRNYLLNRPESTAYYYWPPAGRGEKIVDEGQYKRIVELLLHLDFATLDKAVGSTRRWVSEVGMGSRWGYEVVGTNSSVNTGTTAAGASAVNNLSGLVKRKRSDTSGQPEDTGAKVNVLSAGLVKRKPKEEPPNPEVNVLTAGLVRKKPKE
ncbi:histone acetylation protein-domain-containing protein [Stachybotrys elegans]|uniref:histone acetyltransferase n=1 Tax=Stachybotrys elegans TaxID=80388 RepID=A0A8K0SUN1_9HYPO|nr:histone acetylation protein-domain-containing protein [Stachybotrys elegans]